MQRLEQIIALENEVVAIRSAAVKALLSVMSDLAGTGVDLNVLMTRLDSLCGESDDQVARIGRCAAASFRRQVPETVT